MAHSHAYLLALVVVGLGMPAAAADLGACSQVVRHRPAPDTVYVPGVDVRGRRVVPADLGSETLDLPEEMQFEITVPMPRRHGRRFGRESYDGEALVGLLTLHRDGSLSFNGRPMATADEAALQDACAAALRRR